MFSLGSPPACLVRPAPPPINNTAQIVPTLSICRWWYSLSFTPLSSPVAANNKEKQPNEQHPHKNSNNNDDLDPQHGNKQKNDSALQIHPLVSLGPPSRRRYYDGFRFARPVIPPNSDTPGTPDTCTGSPA